MGPTRQRLRSANAFPLTPAGTFHKNSWMLKTSRFVLCCMSCLLLLSSNYSQKSVLSLPELRCYGDELVEYLTAEWKSDNEWSTQAGHLGRSPQPHLTPTLRVVPICLPYGYDAAKRERHETSSSSIAQTLFQYLNPQGDARRDQKQVRSQRDTFGPAKQLYTSQLWALLIDDSKLAPQTNARLD